MGVPAAAARLKAQPRRAIPGEAAAVSGRDRARRRYAAAGPEKAKQKMTRKYPPVQGNGPGAYYKTNNPKTLDQEGAKAPIVFALQDRSDAV